MAYDLSNLKGGFQERYKDGKLPQGHKSAMEVSNRDLELMAESLNPLKNLGFVMGEGGKVPEKDGVPRMFMLKPDENGIDRITTLDQAGIKFGTREFWSQVQQGNMYAYPTGSADPVQIQTTIKPGSRPAVTFSAPLEMNEVHQPPANHNYRAPGFFTRLFNRMFPNYRKTDCEIYKERQKFSTMAEKREKSFASEKEELKAAEKIAEANAKKDAEKKAYERFEKEAGLKQKGKDFYIDLVAPKPKYHPEESRSEGARSQFYDKQEFESLKPIDKQLKDYKIGEKGREQVISADEYCGLVMICSHDEKYVDNAFKKESNYDDTFKQTLMNAGYTSKQASDIIVNSYSTMISDDLMKGDLRANQGVHLEDSVNPARHQVFDILEQYKQGNKAPLAEKIAECITQSAAVTDEYYHTPHNGAFNRFEFTAATADMLDRDPELKKLAMEKGLKQQDIDAVKGMREYSKLDSKRGEAKTALAKAVYEGNNEMSYQDKLKYCKDIINANIMEAKLLGENTKRTLAGKAIDKEQDRLKKDAYDNKLVLTQDEIEMYAKNPGTRPMPPKGKFYEDQVISLMQGRKGEFNKHPETLSELNDPESMTDCKLITEDIIEQNGLADLSVNDLNKALNGPGNRFSGVKLIEAAEKSAHKIQDQRMREELGIGGPEAEKNPELDKSFDLGSKEPKKPEAGVPVA